jgi:hypothetical protein
MNIKFRHESRRNTKCYSVQLGELTCYISYETVVAFSYPGKRLRLHNYWGPTTRRHMIEQGVDNYPEAENQSDFEFELDQAFMNMVRDDVARALTKEPLYAMG